LGILVIVILPEPKLIRPGLFIIEAHAAQVAHAQNVTAAATS
jgi:hypothetical protein